MKKLPLGIQEFSEIIKGNFIYVDKTEQINRLLDRKYYFLSRPRRFGKSLLLNTIKEIFLGNKELFKGLWIYDKIDWQPHKVIKISFSNMPYKHVGLEKAIDEEMDIVASTLNVDLAATNYSAKFRELILKLSKDTNVVVLIDEYDKPIIDYFSEPEKAAENRDILKSFYSVVKDADQHLRFFMVTGVSKFSKVSMFSDLNNLEDITLNPNYATMLGWTPEELDSYFDNFIQDVQLKYNQFVSDIKPKMREWYNGYSWDGQNFVYNPVSMMNFFENGLFSNYWFATGTPTFLAQLFRDKGYTTFDIEKRKMSANMLDKYDLTELSPVALLFQTGYLTIKEYDIMRNLVVLDYPNLEVADSFTKNLLAVQSAKDIGKTDLMLNDMADDFTDGRINDFVEKINYLFSNIPNTIIDVKEKYYHSIFFMVMKLLGFRIDCEILTIRGRIDAVVETPEQIVIIEFKINQDAKVTIQQIRERGYADKYANDPRPKRLLGINFDTETRKVADYILEEA